MRLFPTVAARIRPQVKSCRICGRQSGIGAGFLRVLRFLLPIFIPPIAPQSPSSVIWGWYNRPVVAAIPSGLNLNPLRIKNKNRLLVGRAITQVVLVGFPPRPPGFDPQIMSCGICGGQSGTGASFLRVLLFPLSILIPLNAPYSFIIRGWYNRQISGRRTKWTQFHPIPQNEVVR
jgi:hypothetical protein